MCMHLPSTQVHNAYATTDVHPMNLTDPVVTWDPAPPLVGSLSVSALHRTLHALRDTRVMFGVLTSTPGIDPCMSPGMDYEVHAMSPLETARPTVRT